MKTSFTLETWWWGDGQTPKGNTVPRWWMNFIEAYPGTDWHNILTKHAKYRVKNNGTIRVVFNSSEDLTFFLLRWS